MYAPGLISLLDAWQLPEPRTLRQLDIGTNNLSYRVVTPSGEYLLRIYAGTTASTRIWYEHRLLRHLSELHLTFAVPVPVPFMPSHTLKPILGCNQSASLFPWLPGEHPGLALASVRTCGRALAELDLAMGYHHLDVRNDGLESIPMGDLYHVSPLIPDPLAMIEELPLPSDERAMLSRIMEEVIVQTSLLYDNSLPQQIVHCDFDPSNVLMEDGCVTAVLDFEFARTDLRALDLAISLAQFSTDPLLRTAFAAGYAEILALSRQELEAIPVLMLLYRAVSLVHREAKRRQGQAGEGAVLTRAHALLAEVHRLHG